MDLLDGWLNSGCPVAGLPSLRAIKLIFTYIAILAILGIILPGKVISGITLSDGTFLKYKCNGFQILSFLAILSGICFQFNIFSPMIIADLAGELFSTTLLLCIIFCFVLYIFGLNSKSKSSSLKPKFSNNVLHDLWYGIQLNPSLFGIDLKFLCLRFGMILWFILNVAILFKHFQNFGQICNSMLLYQLFTNFYIFDYFWHEEFMTSTWDIIAENLGFMLIFGDLLWIPFTFSIQAWWLLKHPKQISFFFCVFVTLIFIIGYCVFRGANSQKHRFKKNSQILIWGKKPKVIGKRLLASGYWGIARHCNYLGDLLLALSFTLPCGFDSILPYFYPIYLFILLIWRERRDEEKCKFKYKEIWKEYCAQVPWRIFPYLY